MGNLDNYDVHYDDYGNVINLDRLDCLKITATKFITPVSSSLKGVVRNFGRRA